MEIYPVFKKDLILRWKYPKLIYISNTTPIKIPEGFFADIKLFLKFIRKYEGLKWALNILKKKNEAGKLTLPHLFYLLHSYKNRNKIALAGLTEISGTDLRI